MAVNAETPYQQGDGSTLTDRVRALLPLVASRAAECEKSRMVPVDVIDALKEAGFFSALAPRVYGGAEGDLLDWTQACRLLASADMSTAWVAGVMGGKSLAVGYYAKKAQDEVWANGPTALICSSLAPRGKAERVEGGVILNGKFTFASGCDHSDWAMLGFVIPEGGDLAPGHRVGLVPRSDYRIEDDWFTSGMCGTGSKTLVVENVFVPEYRWFGPGVERGPMEPGVHANPIYSVSVDFWSAFYICVMIGGAQGAVAAAAEALRGRVSHAPGRTAVSVPRQLRLGEAALRIRAAAAQVDGAMRKRADAYNRGYVMSAEELAWMHAEESCASRIAREGVDLLLEEAGATQQMLDRPLQRFWRDIHTGSEHVHLDMLARSEACGRMLLGMPLAG